MKTSTEAPPEFVDVVATCKFCKIALVLKVDPSGANSPMFNMDVMVKMAACNRCSDYYTRIRSAGESIAATAFHFRSKMRPEIEAMRRETLDRTTKYYVGLVCDHYHVPRQWDKEFCDIIVEKPESVYIILRAYRKQIMTNARNNNTPRLPHAD